VGTQTFRRLLVDWQRQDHSVRGHTDDCRRDRTLRQAIGSGHPWFCHWGKSPECPDRLAETRATPDLQQSWCMSQVFLGSTGSPEEACRLSVLLLESVPDEEGDLLAVDLDAAAHRVGDENPVLVVDLDRCWPPELLFSL
jgi:hypothetical protein